MSKTNYPGILYVVAAPSGAGKTSLVKQLANTLTDIKISISHTTRPKRPKEIDKENYIFVSKERFESLEKEGAFIEMAKVFGHYYGTSRAWVEEQLATGYDVILEIDWQGAQQIRAVYGKAAVTIFIVPPSMAVLEERLRGRGQDDEAVIQRRLAEAGEEMAHYHEFDYMVINDNFDIALGDLQCIVHTQRLRTASQEYWIKPLLETML
ncbi:MAG: guanylate kinase [Gammaproteobacteria bacterium]